METEETESIEKRNETKKNREKERAARFLKASFFSPHPSSSLEA